MYYLISAQLGWTASATESNSQFEEIDLTDKVSQSLHDIMCIEAVDKYI